ncbi:hypothetical protein X319_00412, partial [Mycobacterium tuberculosis XTB13-100]
MAAPVVSNSAIASGMEAAEVFPVCSISLATTASGR